MDIKELSKKKSFRIAYFVFSLLLGVGCFYGMRDLVRQTHTRGVAHDISAAVDELQKSPPGIEGAEVFLKRLKAIDPGFAPAEVKDALHDYTSSTEQALNDLKAGHDIERDDQAMAEAKQRLVSAIKKWE